MMRKVDFSLFEKGLCPIFKEFGYALLEGQDADREFFELLESAKEASAVVSYEGDLLWTSTAFEELFGFLGTENHAQSLYDLVLPEYRELLHRSIDSASHHISEDRFRPQEKLTVFRGRNAFGEIRSYECFFTGCWRNGNRRIAAAFRDTTGNQHLVDQFKKLEENYSTLSETINEALIRIDENLSIVFANSAVVQIFGYTKEELIGQNFSMLFPPEIFERHSDELKKYFLIDGEHRNAVGLPRSLEILGKHKRRGVSPMEMSFGNSTHFNGRTLTCIIRDITQQKNLERQLRKLAYHDKLTNLGNRDLFNEEVGNHLQNISGFSGIRGAIMFLDLDGFKHINDTLGHKAGDNLLIETGGRLRRCVRESDTIYRFGGDEFVILLSHIHTKEDAEVVARKLLSTVRSPFHLDEKDEHGENTIVSIGVSIGIAVFPDDGDNSEQLIKNADLAMYSAKEGGKNRYSFYDETLTSKATFQLKIEQGIKKALNDGLLELQYQPLVDFSGEIEGVEVLLRWTDPELGRVSPSVFIPVVEEKGLIYPVGSWVLETACKSLSELSKTGFDSLYVSLNVSPLQLEDERFVEKLRDTILRNGVDPSMLQLELTESTLMRNPERMNSILHRIKEDNPGIRIAIDDFGTGYSSLSYLSTIPADSLKIDASFVSNIHEAHNRKIIGTIINLADSLELKVVAEGVETEAQLNSLQEISCHTLQGFYFSKPLPKAELYEMLRSEPMYA